MLSDKIYFVLEERKDKISDYLPNLNKFKEKMWQNTFKNFVYNICVFIVIWIVCIRSFTGFGRYIGFYWITSKSTFQ